MSETVDVNVLIYATDESSPFHGRALALVERLATGSGVFYLLWPVLMGYLRIATNPRIFATPQSPDQAVATIESLVALRHSRVVGEADGFWESYRAVAREVAARGDLVPDAHLVALMRQHGIGTIWTHDRDFRLFDGITVRDPFG